MKMPRALQVLTRDRETSWWFTAVVCVPYLAFLIWMHVHHEMWRDEVHSWTLSRLAQGFGELVTGDRSYEGHPPLWFWYLHVWSWLTKEAWGIQAATVTAAIAAAALLVRFAPFPRYLKVLLLCSYYLGYEYTVMSRNYVLGWFLLCLFCAAYHPLRVRYLASAVILSLLSLTSVYGLAMSVCLLMFFVLDNFRFSLAWARSSPPAGPPATFTLSASPRLLGAFALTSAAILFCAVSLQPPDPNPFSRDWNFGALNADAVPDMLARLVGGFIPLRPFSAAFWTSSLTLWDGNSGWSNIVGVGLLLAALVALYPSWRLMLSYLAAVVIMELFQTTRYRGDPRHWGHYFVFFLAATWLARLARPRRRHLLSTLLLLGVLGFQIESFLAATSGDTRTVFSGGRETAAFIRRAGLQDLPIVAGPDWFVITVTGYLLRPFVSVETEEVHDTVVFHSRRQGFSARALVDRAASLSRERRSPVLVISNQPLPPAPPGSTLSWLFTSRPGSLGDEIFSVYRMDARMDARMEAR
jgi:hypothetical protein